MKVKDLLKELEGVDPEARVIIDDPVKWAIEIERIGIEKDIDHEDDEPLIIVVLYPEKYKYQFKILENFVPGKPVKCEIPETGDFEFRDESGMTLNSWKENENVYWVKLPDEEIKEIRAYEVENTKYDAEKTFGVDIGKSTEG